jgi:photosystem II stability/assembly factor-like uncharacterized protein
MFPVLFGSDNLRSQLRRFSRGILAACVVSLISCVSEPGGSGDPSHPSSQGGQGSLTLNLSMHENDPVLSKTTSADTIFNLDSVKIILTSPNTPSRFYAYPLNGRPDTGSISLKIHVDSLPALRIWTAKIFTLDTTLNPIRTDTVHLDSVAFAVYPGDTVFIGKTLGAAFSILRVRLASLSPDSIPDAIQYLRIRVDGVTRDSFAIGNTLNAVDFLQGFPAVGFSVGERGRILKTRNNGTTWTTLHSGTNQTLNSVSFVPTDSSRGWAAGNNGTLLKTTNGGKVWSAQVSGTSENLTRVQFPMDAATGFAVGDAGSILKTQDGGTTWSIMRDGWFPLPSGTTLDFNAVRFADTTTGYAVGNTGSIFKTTNGGLSWVAQTSNTTNTLNAVAFANASIGIAIGASGTLRRTSNGGATWSTPTVSGGTLNGLNAVSFVAGSTAIAYAVGDNGLAAKTTNGGVNWTYLSATTVGAGTGSLRSIAFQDANVGCIVGDAGMVRKLGSASSSQTYASGSSSTSLITGAPNLKSVDYVGSTNSFIAAGDGGKIYKTTNFNNGTPSWTALTSSTVQNLTQIDFISSTIGFTIGNSGIVLKTSNGGTNWIASDTASQPLRGLSLSTAYIGYAVGPSGTIVKTSSGGARWPSSTAWNTLSFTSNTTGWVAGKNGILLTTSSADAGRVWTSQSSGTTQDLNGMHFFSATEGQLVGNAGTVCRTLNGTSWTCFTAGNRPLKSVVVTSTGSNGVVYAVGESIWACTNFSGTQVWTQQTGINEQPLNGVDFTASNTGYAVGGLETIVGTVNGGPLVLQNEGAKQFDTLLTYKYLRPKMSHTVLLEAMTRYTLPLKGYQKVVSINLSPGMDTTIIPGSSLTKCGYGGTVCQ